MAEAMQVPAEIQPAGAPSPGGGSLLDKLKAKPALVAVLVIGGIVGLILILRSRSGGETESTIIPTIIGGNSSGTDPVDPVDPAVDPATPTPLPSPTAGYNMVLDVTGDGATFIQSLRQFNISGRVIGTPVTGDNPYSRVELKVPTGPGQWWFKTLASDVRVKNISVGSGYTSLDVVDAAKILWKRLPSVMPSAKPSWWPEGTAWPIDLSIIPEAA